MKRVLFISSQPFFQWRGSPIRVGFDVQALAELGYEVDLLTLPMGERKDIPGVRVVRAPNLLMARELSIGPSFRKALFDVILLFMAIGMVLRRRYDVVHGVEDAGAIGVLIKTIARSRLVFEKHSDPGSYRKGFWRNAVMWLYAQVERFTVRHADAVIGTGLGLVQQARGMKGCARVCHIFDIPSSQAIASTAKTAEIRRRLQRSETDLLATYVGSFAVYQGVDLLFAAIPPVVRSNPRARFVIIGGTPDEIAERRNRLSAQGIEEKVLFAGKIPPDELPDYLAASDVLLSPRQAGVNTPLKLLDYLKAGRAIVATDTSANRQILDERTAVLVPPESGAFAEGILRVLGNEGERTRLGEDGRRLTTELYNFEEFRKRLGECYQNLTEDARTADRPGVAP